MAEHGCSVNLCSELMAATRCWNKLDQAFVLATNCVDLPFAAIFVILITTKIIKLCITIVPVYTSWVLFLYAKRKIVNIRHRFQIAAVTCVCTYPDVFSKVSSHTGERFQKFAVTLVLFAGEVWTVC